MILITTLGTSPSWATQGELRLALKSRSLSCGLALCLDVASSDLVVVVELPGYEGGAIGVVYALQAEGSSKSVVVLVVQNAVGTYIGWVLGIQDGLNAY